MSKNETASAHATFRTFAEIFAEIDGTPGGRAGGVVLDISESFYRRLEDLGMSYEELAEKLGLTVRKVRNILAGRASLTILEMVTIAMALGTRVQIALSTDELVYPAPNMACVHNRACADARAAATID